MKARIIKKLRNKIKSKDYIEKRIIKLSRRLDKLVIENTEYMFYDVQRKVYKLIKFGDIESKNVAFINAKKIIKLEKKIEYYKKKL